MKVVAISDTHGQHHALKNLPKADLLIHAGDVSKQGTIGQVQDFLQWYGQLDYPYKVLIAGNHDFFFEKSSKHLIQEMIPDNVIYLNDSGIEIEGFNIWGSPVQPWFYDWAFNRERGKDIQQHWDLIPQNTDILITHGPPMGVLDLTARDQQHVGCEDLMQQIQKIKPKVHIFGHIHEAYGLVKQNDTTYINASCLNLHYQLVNPPVEFELSL